MKFYRILYMKFYRLSDGQTNRHTVYRKRTNENIGTWETKIWHLGGIELYWERFFSKFLLFQSRRKHTNIFFAYIHILDIWRQKYSSIVLFQWKYKINFRKTQYNRYSNKPPVELLVSIGRITSVTGYIRVTHIQYGTNF